MEYIELGYGCRPHRRDSANWELQEFRKPSNKGFAKNLRDQADAWRSMMPKIRMPDRYLHNGINMAFGLNDDDMPVHEALDMLADPIDPEGGDGE